MWDFKFSAPQYYNFYRPQKINYKIQINITDPNDQWFMQQHVQLTPVKQSIYANSKQNIAINQLIENHEKQPNNKQASPIKEISKSIIENNIKNISKKRIPIQNVQKLKRNNINDKNNRSTSSSEITFKYKILSKPKKQIIHEQQHQYENQQHDSKNQKISKTKSQPQMHTTNEKQKIRMPCPYARKIQKDWQNKSNKSWYCLSQNSAKKAMESMKKILQKNKKEPKKDNKPRFKF